VTNDIAPSYVHRILHSDVESAPSAAAAELPRRPSGAVDLGNPLLNAISSAVRETLVSMVIIITRTAHSEALIVRGTGYNDNALDRCARRWSPTCTACPRTARK
jgi:hypothetical protein